jgi:hypothetical protein
MGEWKKGSGENVPVFASGFYILANLIFRRAAETR